MFFISKAPLLSAIVFLLVPFKEIDTPSAGLLSLVCMVPFNVPPF